jgi:hypothetical protein
MSLGANQGSFSFITSRSNHLTLYLSTRFVTPSGLSQGLILTRLIAPKPRLGFQCIRYIVIAKCSRPVAASAIEPILLSKTPGHPARPRYSLSASLRLWARVISVVCNRQFKSKVQQYNPLLTVRHEYGFLYHQGVKLASFLRFAGWHRWLRQKRQCNIALFNKA